MDERDYQEAATHAAIAGQNTQNAASAAQYYLEEKEKGLVDIQLEVDSIKTDIYHLLRQDKLTAHDEHDKLDWKPVSENQRTLTDWGVERIMQIIHFYINKNTLLTNFDADQIRGVMETFMKELNDLILLKYEYLFKEPTLDECKTLLKEKTSKEVELKMLTQEILGQEITEAEITKDVQRQIEGIIEKEIVKIKEEKRKERIKECGMILAQLEVIVLATLNRAFRGEERGSIRRHTQISELIGGSKNLHDNPVRRGGSVFSWGKR